MLERNGLDAIVEIAEMLGGAANSGKSFGSCAAQFRIFQDADAKAAKLFVEDFAWEEWGGERRRLGRGRP